jgi:hypothetical protein
MKVDHNIQVSMERTEIFILFIGAWTNLLKTFGNSKHTPTDARPSLMVFGISNHMGMVQRL